MKKRNFVALTRGEGNRKSPFYVQVWEVNKDKILQTCGTTKFNPNSTKGVSSEALSVLYEQGMISEECFNKNNGYYRVGKTLDGKTEINIQLL